MSIDHLTDQYGSNIDLMKQLRSGQPSVRTPAPAAPVVQASASVPRTPPVTCNGSEESIRDLRLCLRFNAMHNQWDDAATLSFVFNNLTPEVRNIVGDQLVDQATDGFTALEIIQKAMCPQTTM